jgi:uncharacterized protein (TIGR04255 family)
MAQKFEQYPAAPITEAVMEFRFSGAYSIDAVRKVADAFTREYGPISEQNDFEFGFDLVEGRAMVRHDKAGFRLASNDQIRVLVLRPKSFICSRLAPYAGWDELKSRALVGYDRWKKIAGFKPLERVGVRYINRIDVPNTGAKIQLEDYLRIHPRVPVFVEPAPVDSYTLQVVQTVLNKYKLTINTATVPPPSINFFSFLLDIDVGLEKPKTVRSDDLSSLLDEMRDVKNTVFEQLITDRLREIFRRKLK